MPDWKAKLLSLIQEKVVREVNDSRVGSRATFFIEEANDSLIINEDTGKITYQAGMSIVPMYWGIDLSNASEDMLKGFSHHTSPNITQALATACAARVCESAAHTSIPKYVMEEDQEVRIKAVRSEMMQRVGVLRTPGLAKQEDYATRAFLSVANKMFSPELLESKLRGDRRRSRQEIQELEKRSFLEAETLATTTFSQLRHYEAIETRKRHLEKARTDFSHLTDEEIELIVPAVEDIAQEGMSRPHENYYTREFAQNWANGESTHASFIESYLDSAKKMLSKAKTAAEKQDAYHALLNMRGSYASAEFNSRMTAFQNLQTMFGMAKTEQEQWTKVQVATRAKALARMKEELDEEGNPILRPPRFKKDHEDRLTPRRPPAVTKWDSNEGLSDGWGRMEIKREPLVYPVRQHQMQARWTANDSDGRLRDPARYRIDQRIFSTKHYIPGGTMLVDDSGSMGLTESDLEKILDCAPAMTVALYSGSGSSGELQIRVWKGRRTAALATKYGGNVIDGPAAQWLVRQKAPLIYITDQGYAGMNDHGGADLHEDMQKIMKGKNVHMFESPDTYIKHVRRKGLPKD